MEYFEEILRHAPRDAVALANMGTFRVQHGAREEGLRLLGLALEVNPDQPLAWNSHGAAQKALGRHEEALASYERAIAIAPDHAVSHGNRGNALRELGRREEARASYDKAIELQPGNVATYNHRGALLQDMGKFQDALVDFDRALVLDPHRAETWFNRGTALDAMNRPDLALADFARAIALKPDYPAAFNNRSKALKALNRIDEALADCDNAIALKPDHVEAHWNKSLLHLLQGDYLTGWALYEWRWRRKDRNIDPRHALHPLWQGDQDVRGKTVVLWSEQGFGDCIQFCRYALQVEALGARAVLEVPPPLVGLMRSLSPSIAVQKAGSRLPPFDYHCPVMSLPHLFRTDLTSIPSPSAYLQPPASKAQAWNKRVGGKTRPRVGLAWAGNPEHGNDANRSIGLDRLQSLLAVDVEFHSLQKDLRPGDDALLEATPGIKRWETELHDFSDTAALVSLMDIVISVDSSVAHLAAALGRQTWILLPFSPDFRWMLGREDSPWYPSARLFRQPVAGDWDTVAVRVAALLASTYGLNSAPESAQHNGNRIVPGKKPRRSSIPKPKAPAAKRATTPAGKTNALGNAAEALKSGKVAEAEDVARLRLKANPDDIEALKLLSVCLSRDKSPQRRDELLRVCQAVVDRAPQDFEAMRNLALALRLNKQPKAAFDILMKRVNLAPKEVAYHLDAARFLREIGKTDEAVKAYRHASRLKPDSTEILIELAAMHKSQGQLGEAIGVYRKALSIAPESAPVHNALGAIFGDVGKLKESIDAFTEAVRLAPKNATYQNNLGNTLYRVGRIAEASKYYLAAQELKPDFYFALTQGLHSRRQLCDWSTLEANLDAIRVALADEKARGLTPFVLLSQPGISLAESFVCARRFSHDRHAPQLRRPPLINSAKPHPRKDGKIRIGYLSADFHEHATSYLMVGVLEHHDRNRFEVYGYSYGPDDRSATRDRVRKSFDVFREVRTLTDLQAAKKILEDGIDILIDLKGFTRDMRLGIQALRPAPVVVSWLGYPGTLGEPRMADYIIGDPTVTPLEHAPHYSEKLALMPHTYQPNDRSRQVGPVPTRAEVGLPEKVLVFCTFNQPYKITPDMLDLWCRILVAVPDSVLWILEPKDATAKGNLVGEVEKREVAASRVIFAAKKPQSEHLARLSLADIALDTLPYTSHTTCSDALWVGLPLVTLLGETFPARVAAGLLRTMDLPELVTETPEAFVQTVLDLARHPKKLKALRQKILKNRDTSPLFDTVRFTRDLEGLYRRMWKNHLALHLDHIVPWPVERELARRQGRKPAPMRIAVVTPYYQETEAELWQCHESVLKQTVECTHFMVADGFPQTVVDNWDVRHVKLPVAHGDGGNCARAAGSMAVIGENYDAIAFLDADNWYAPNHLETLLALQDQTGADICFARRNLHRVDGSLMCEDNVSDGGNFVDTSCYLITRPAFGVLSVWGLMPKELWGVCDRVFFGAIKTRAYATAVASAPTVAYRTRWAEHYAKLGEKPPEGGERRTEIFSRSMQAFLTLTPVQRSKLFL